MFQRLVLLALLRSFVEKTIFAGLISQSAAGAWRLSQLASERYWVGAVLVPIPSARCPGTYSCGSRLLASGSSRLGQGIYLFAAGGGRAGGRARQSDSPAAASPDAASPAAASPDRGSPAAALLAAASPAAAGPFMPPLRPHTTQVLAG